MIQILKIKYFTLHVFLPLLAGTIVYLFFRSTPIIALSFIQPSEIIFHIENSSNALNFFVGSFPDFCWLYALLSIQSGLIWGELKKIPLAILFFLYTAPIVTEILQHYNIIKGTADNLDIVAYLLAIVFHYIIHKNKIYEPKTQVYC